VTNTSTTRNNPWIACCRPNHRADVRLFCFPYSGASASIFYTWPNMLPATIEVYPVQLPGRETRLAEPPFTDLTTAVHGQAVRVLRA
jgi:medium-chain acyl-[acyl-carrier-protein] hydrolase